MQIIVDTESITSQYDVSKDQIDQLIDSVVKDITANFAERLAQQAREKLHKTRSVYLSNISVFDEGRFNGVVMLDYSKNKLVKMIEEGATAFDMKKGFEESSKKHLKKDGNGWYLTVPFSVGTPGAIGESDPFSFTMPEEVYNVVKEKDANIPTTSGSFKSKALAQSEIPAEYATPTTRKEVTNIITNKKFEEYKAKTSIYAGISKVQDPTTGQNTYQSFRRISDKSDPNSWVFSGLQAKNLTDAAMNDLESHLEEELHNATESALTKLGINNE